MNRHLFAYFLACLAAAGFFVGFLSLAAPHYLTTATTITIRTNSDVDDSIRAIEGLHLKDAKITQASALPAKQPSSVFMIFSLSFGLAIITGLVLFFYKLFCRWLKVESRV